MEPSVVVNLLPLTAAHEGWLGTLVVDVGPEVLDKGLWRRLRLLNRLVDDGLSLLVDFLRHHVSVSAPRGEQTIWSIP